MSRNIFRRKLMRGSALAVIGFLFSAPAFGQSSAFSFDIPAEPLAQSLHDYARISGQQIVFSQALVAGRTAPAVSGQYSSDEALNLILAGTDLMAQRSASGGIMVRPKNVEAASNDGAARGANVEAVLVTAEKKAERIQDAPVPVTVVNTDQLADKGDVGLQDYFARVPGFIVSPIHEQNQVLSIRGITTGGNAVPTVGVIIDDVPFGNPVNQGNAIPNIDPGDLDRIEVLRGPQGALYGASSMGGLLKYVTKTPTTDGFSGRIEFGTESTNNGGEPGFQVRGSANIPLSDTLAIRVSAFQRQDPGYIDDPFRGLRGVNEVHASGARLAVLWQVSDNVSVNLSALYQDDRGDGVPEVTVGPGLGDLQQHFIPNIGPSNRMIQAYTATVQADFGDIGLESITGYNLSKYNDLWDTSAAYGAITQTYFGSASDTFADHFHPANFTQEVRVTAPIGEDFHLLVGGFAALDQNKVHQIATAENPTTGQFAGVGLDATVDYAYNEYAGFTDLTYNVTDRLDIQLGGRYSDISNRVGPLYEIGPIATGASTTPLTPAILHAHFDTLTYLFTPEFKLSPDMMAYARLASGYRPGGPNTPNIGAPANVNPDKTYNYELGLKGDFLDHMISVDASLYYIDWRGIQISLRAPNGFGYSANGGNAKSEGVEFSLDVRPWTGFTLSSWIDYDNAVLTQTFPTSATVAGNTGDRLPNSPQFSGNFSAQQEFPLIGGATGFAGFTVTYMGDRVSVFRGTGQARQAFPEYTKLDLNLGANYESWKADLYLNNVTDSRGILDGGLGYTNPSSFIVTRPRTIGLSITKLF